jgi:agmatinase
VTPDGFPMQPFSGRGTFMHLPEGAPDALGGVDAAIVGIPLEAGTSSFRVAGRMSPAAIRQVSSLLRPFHPAFGFALPDRLRVVDYGDLAVVPGFSDVSLRQIESGMAPLVRAGVTPVVLGGSHIVTLPVLRALAARHGAVGLLQFDAHTDTYQGFGGQRYTAGTMFRRGVEEGIIDPGRSVQIGIRGSANHGDPADEARALGYDVITMDRLAEKGVGPVLEAARRRLAGGAAYLTFDMDFVDPAYAPAVAVPTVGGATSREALGLLRGLRGTAFVGYDVVSIDVPFDAGQQTVLLGATVAHECLFLCAASRRTASTDSLAV